MAIDPSDIRGHAGRPDGVDSPIASARGEVVLHRAVNERYRHIAVAGPPAVRAAAPGPGVQRQGPGPG
ncbi:MAG: hypothetical protein KJ011_07375, partial [Burkholderiaceae bacterium]|nr:hypothetical protein [Burkholderiaceae bacterium]